MMNRIVFRRTLAMLLAALLCCGMMAMAVFADGDMTNVMCNSEDLSEVAPDVAPFEKFWGQKEVQRDWVRKVVFHSDLKEMPAKNVWDFSKKWGSGVVGWYTPGELHVAADGKVRLPANSSWMFAYFTNLETLEFNNAVDTSEVQDFSAMFFCCRKLKALDVSCFDTANAVSMSRMFGECISLENLDVTGFKTDKVENFGYMFYLCKGLKSLNVSGFNTGSARYMNSMFAYCTGLESLDTSGFDMSNVISTAYMFSHCSAK